MEKIIDGLKINYKTEGEGDDLLLLHGWGVDMRVMEPMLKHFREYRRVTVLDLPGFGLSQPPETGWSIYDYADFTEKFIAETGLKDPVLLGHSFGGRISIILGSRGIGSKLVLTDAAGIKPKRGADYYARVYSYKAAKKIMSLPGLKNHKEQALEHWRKSNPSSDYNAAQGVMRQIFVKVVNEDLQPLLPQIKVPALLVWGENDTATPLSDGQLMEKLIPDAGLVVFEGCGHYSFLDEPHRYYSVVDYFLQH